MKMVIDLGQGSYFDKARRMREVIGAHGKEMTHDAIDRAVDLWDSLIKRGLTNQATEEEIMQKSQKKGLDQELLERGRAFVKLGFKPRQAAQMALDTARKIGSNQGGTVAPKTTQTPLAPQPTKHLRWGAMPGIWGNDRLMVEDSATAMPQAPPTPPQRPRSMGNAAWDTTKKDNSNLSGHQQAALKVGVDLERVSSATLEKMDMGQMQGLAREQQLAQLEEQRASQPLRDHPGPWGTMPGFGSRR
jgi:hypothetical protein